MSQLSKRNAFSLRREWRLFDQERGSPEAYLKLCNRMIEVGEFLKVDTGLICYPGSIQCQHAQVRELRDVWHPRICRLGIIERQAMDAGHVWKQAQRCIVRVPVESEVDGFATAVFVIAIDCLLWETATTG